MDFYCGADDTMSEWIVVDSPTFHGICRIHSGRITSLARVGVTVSSMIGSEKSIANGILTGLAGLADRTRRLIEWLTSGQETPRSELTHYERVAE